ncbi:molybdopterin cofactor-binding domain-containing protein [Inquilinus sp. CA228]|uniref:xanthine dehydrogenase family protein molybdopterin-binding subunit n=1 Tax=Inquilinus sp. CA228 TaxID=3455609 RepID=UPI003F8D284F
MTIMQPVISRRGFVFGISALGGGLVLGLRPGAALAQPDLDAIAGAPEVTAWVVIEPDDTTVIRIARSEMGQGIATALAMLVAEELECDWSRVRTEYIGAAENLARGKPWGDMVTSNSNSVRNSQEMLRKAGAQARSMLLAEAAGRWGVPVEDCSAKDSVVSHAGTGRTLRYGEIAEAASRRPVPAEVTLKPPEAWHLIGTPVRRLDTVEKTMGQPIYASDMRLPGMLYAAVSACPAYGGKLKGFDAGTVQAMPGVHSVVPVGDSAVAVVAASWWQAKTALDALPVTWDESGGAGLSTDALQQMFEQGLDADGDAKFALRRGDVDAALASAVTRIEAVYRAPYLAHGTMEPQTCTAHVTADRAEIWAPTQNGEGTLRAVAGTLKLDPSQVIVHKRQLGGGFGRRGIAQDWARQAALIGKAVGLPVKVVWSREEDITHDYYRPMVAARHVAGFDALGRLVAWRVRVCGSSIAATLSPQWLRDGQDMAMTDGFHDDDMLYDVPNFESGSVIRTTAIPVGFWRGVNLSQNGYFREAFVDEMAQASGQDPYQFRRTLLAGAPRTLAVLDEAARRAGWGQAPDGIHQGIAVIEGDGSVCAQVVEISVGTDGTIKLHRVVCAVDPGYAINPDTITAQIESAIIQGLSAALSGEITFKDGRPEQSNFHDYTILRIDEVPPVETAIVPSGDRYSDRWGGIGETGLPPVAAALANAVFAATGKRIRTLPLKAHKLWPG